MGYEKRKSNSKVKVTMNNFEELKANFLSDIKAVVLMEEILPPLILNWDHKWLKYLKPSYFSGTLILARGLVIAKFNTR